MKELFILFSYIFLLNTYSALSECEAHYKTQYEKNMPINNNIIHLINTENIIKDVNPYLFDYFVGIVELLGYNIKILNDECLFCLHDGVKATEIATKYFLNVINLSAHIVDSNFTTHQNVIIVGNVQLTEPKPCTESEKCDAQVIQCSLRNNKMKCEMMHVVHIGKTFATVVSKNIKNFKRLFKFTENLIDWYKKPWDRQDMIEKYNQIYPLRDERVVCLCESHIKTYDIDHSKLKRIHLIKCDHDYPNNVTAILSGKSFEIDDDHEDKQVNHVPVIFYNATYMLPEYLKMYPNSLAMFQESTYIAMFSSGFINLCELQAWRRIAVLSDDSPHSVAFEVQLRKGLEQRGMLFTIKSCLAKKCDFSKTLASLKNIQAKIILVNVGYKYAMELVTQAVVANMTSNQGYLWIWRDWPFENKRYIRSKIAKLGDVYSISLNKPDIEKSLEILETAIESIEANDLIDLDMLHAERKREFYRHLLEEYSNLQKKQNVDVHFTRISSNGMKVTLKKKESLAFNDFPSDCMFYSNTFDAPCDNVTFLVIMLVISGMMIILLVIIVSYIKLTSGTISYQNLF